MNILYIDKSDAKLKITSKLIYINSRQIPYTLIDTIIFTGNYNLSTKDILTLNKAQISIIFINSTLSNFALIYSNNNKNAELKSKQYKASLNPLPIAKDILTLKIKKHIEHLEKFNIKLQSNSLLKIQNSNSIEELLGIEGSFSKLYFNHYFKLFPKKLTFQKRSKQPPKDPVNAILSFNYTLFYNLITTRLLSYGFEPLIGFLHKPFRSHNALSSDILEIYRADINDFTYQLFNNKTLTINDFSKKGEGVFLKYSSRKTFWQEFNKFNSKISPKIDETISIIRSKL